MSGCLAKTTFWSTKRSDPTPTWRRGKKRAFDSLGTDFEIGDVASWKSWAPKMDGRNVKILKKAFWKLLCGVGKLWLELRWMGLIQCQSHNRQWGQRQTSWLRNGQTFWLSSGTDGRRPPDRHCRHTQHSPVRRGRLYERRQLNDALGLRVCTQNNDQRGLDTAIPQEDGAGSLVGLWLRVYI